MAISVSRGGWSNITSTCPSIRHALYISIYPFRPAVQVQLPSNSQTFILCTSLKWVVPVYHNNWSKIRCFFFLKTASKEQLAQSKRYTRLQTEEQSNTAMMLERNVTGVADRKHNHGVTQFPQSAVIFTPSDGWWGTSRNQLVALHWNGAKTWSCPFCSKLKHDGKDWKAQVSLCVFALSPH